MKNSVFGRTLVQWFVFVSLLWLAMVQSSFAATIDPDGDRVREFILDVNPERNKVPFTSYIIPNGDEQIRGIDVTWTTGSGDVATFSGANGGTTEKITITSGANGATEATIVALRPGDVIISNELYSGESAGYRSEIFEIHVPEFRSDISAPTSGLIGKPLGSPIQIHATKDRAQFTSGWVDVYAENGGVFENGDDYRRLSLGSSGIVTTGFTLSSQLESNVITYEIFSECEGRQSCLVSTGSATIRGTNPKLDVLGGASRTGMEGSTDTLSAGALDMSGAPIFGLPIEFISNNNATTGIGAEVTLDSETGYYNDTFIYGPSVGDTSVTIRLRDYPSISSTVRLTTEAPFELDVASGNNQTWVVGHALSSALIVNLSRDGEPYEDAVIDWSVIPGAGAGTFGSGTNLGEGRFAVDFTPSRVGPHTIRATLRNSNVFVDFAATAFAPSFTFNPDAVIGLSGQIRPVSVTLFNGIGGVLAREPVTISVVAGSATASAPTSGLTTLNGQIVVPVTLGQTQGRASLRVSIDRFTEDGQSIATGSADVIVRAPQVSLQASSRLSGLGGTSGQLDLSFFYRDDGEVFPLANLPVGAVKRIRSGGASVDLADIAGLRTDANGNASVGLDFLTEAGDDVIDVSIDGVVVGNFTASSRAPTLQFTEQLSRARIGDATTIPITVTVLDQGVPAAGVPVSLTIDSTSATAIQSSNVSNRSGNILLTISPSLLEEVITVAANWEDVVSIGHKLSMWLPRIDVSTANPLVGRVLTEGNIRVQLTDETGAGLPQEPISWRVGPDGAAQVTGDIEADSLGFADASVDFGSSADSGVVIITVPSPTVGAEVTARISYASWQASLVVDSGDNQSGWASESLADSLAVHLTDNNGAGIVGEPVSWQVLSGQGSLQGQTTATTTTSTATGGIAEVDWQLGTTPGAGEQIVVARSIDGSEVRFSATALDPSLTISPATLTANSGQTQIFTVQLSEGAAHFAGSELNWTLGSASLGI